MQKYNIEQTLSNKSNKKIILVDCMDTILNRNTSLSGIIKRWAKRVGKEFGIFVPYLRNYREDIIVGSMHNVVPMDIIYQELAEQCIYYGMLESNIKSFFCERCHEIEIEVEMRAHKLRMKTIAFLEQEVQKGTKVYCVSDFRMSSNDVKRFFVNQRIDHLFSGIFVSSDIGKTKKDGGLYQYVLDELGVNAEDCIMIGDNLQVDCINSSLQGISAIWINDGI
ncbi:MAG: HAD-IA family hydrolase [Lachnospiraceae bacterium]